MTFSHVMSTRLEKVATDNGFDLSLGVVGIWRAFGSSQTRLRVWLSVPVESLYVVALSRFDVADSLTGLGTSWKSPLPPGGPVGFSTPELGSLHRLVRRAFQLSRALPDEPLHVFEKQTASLPRSTEAERRVIQRVGQEVFRSGLLDYWEGRCAVTGLEVVELLRASHIKPWADCGTDAERLDTFNGLLLAPHFDALFDRGFITFNDLGEVVLSPALDRDARICLGLSSPYRLLRIADAHRRYLDWHRGRVFRG